MDEQPISPFGGVLGRVLRDSMSVGTAITGVVLGLVLLVSGFVFGLVGGAGLGMLFGQILVAVALARFALNGMAGESAGTIFSTAGGSWPMAMAVAGRYLVLNLIWIAPLLILLFSLISAAVGTVALGGGHAASGSTVVPEGAPPRSGAGLGAAGSLPLSLPVLTVLSSKTFIAALTLLIIGTAILPPVFLIVAVRSERFGQIFSTVLWSNTFSGRLGDLYAIYVVHGGALGMLFVLAIPALLLTFAAGKEIGLFCLGIGSAYGGGLAITLLGRLCGFFAFGDEQPGPLFAMAPAGGPVHGPAGGRPGKPRPPEVFGSPASSEVHAGSGAAAPAAGVPAVASADAPPEAAGDPSGAAPFPDLSQEIAEARKHFETDAPATIERLMTLREEHPGHPQVLHAAAVCLYKAGRTPEAVLVAREAVPACLDRGHAVLAAEVFATLWKQAKEMELQHDQIDAIAGVLMKTGDHARAITAYGLALQMDHGDRKAIKGLLQLADHKMHREGRPKDAARIYTFLLQYAVGTPFVEDIRLGLADAEARLSRAS